MSRLTGIDFTALQVRDVAKSAAFYKDILGLREAPKSPPGAVVFATEPIPFAVREPMLELDAVERLGWGVALWFSTDDVDGIYTKVTEAGRPILTEPFTGPFGKTFAFADPDGYAITVHG